MIAHDCAIGALSARDLEIRMREILLALALTSSARISPYDNASGVGTPDYTLVDDRGRAKLGRGDAPHLTFVRAWDAAGEDRHEREQVLKHATLELEHIRKSHANPTTIETKDARDRRIVKDGVGFPARDVAIAMRCGVTDVRKARQAAGRDDLGEPLPNGGGRELTLDERRVEVLRLTDQGLSGRAVAARLNIGHQAVRYVLARRK